MTGQGPRESNERLEFLGDSVLGLVTSEFLYRQHPDEHEGQLTKTKSLVVSKAILSRRALAMGLGRFVLMSHSEVESGGRQRLSILADAFEAVIGAIYLDQGFEAARTFIHQWLLKDTNAIASDERHANYKSHLQEYVQSTFHTHPVYRIRSEYGPDHSKHFMVDVLVGKRTLGSGKGRNKKDAEQAAARNALEQVGAMPTSSERAGREMPSDAEPVEREPRAARPEREPRIEREEARGERPTRGDREDAPRGERPMRGDRDAAGIGAAGSVEPAGEISAEDAGRSRRRGRRGGRGRRTRLENGSAAFEPGVREAAKAPPPPIEARQPEERPDFDRTVERPSRPPRRPWLGGEDDELEEIGRPEGPLEERHVDPFDWEAPARLEEGSPAPEPQAIPAEPSRGERPARRIHAARSIEREELEDARPEGDVQSDPPMAAYEMPPRASRDGLAGTEEADEADAAPAPGSLFSHERPLPPAPEETPRYGRRSRPRSRR